MRKSKLLICALFMSLILTALPGMESYAAGETGESAAQTDLQDENSQRLETVTAMDENGNIYEVGDSDGTVGESTAEGDMEEQSEAEGGISLFSARLTSESIKVVNFNTKSNDTTSFTYSGGSGYTNGDYGADAAYLGTDGNGNIRFMLAGVTGTVKKSEVEVVDYSSVADNVSYYKVSGGKLIHYISYNLNKAPSSSIDNGPAPSYLSEGVKYFSYDGHYFYEDYKTMLKDYQSGSNGASAVNCGNAFYNYFQFLDMNSSTNYSGDELDSILSSKISSSSSKLLGTGTLFVKYQNKYRVNALLSLGIAVNESAWGTSSICMNKNNLFGLNAVDTSPGQSANYFVSVEDCIREFMSEWMADGYLSSSDWRNHGELLGNKGEGINVSYASDPYWGEKAAAIAWELDAAGGSHDYLGISSGSGNESSEDNTDTPSEDNTPPSDAGGTDDANDSSAADNDSDTDDPSEEDSDSEADSSVDTGNGSETENPTDANEPSDTNDPTDA
ncbi:MAG TPA: glucosaminidase domain-containing protein, partial [Candidatus Mediterraneibacter ornithocaccae]|nr:glucosaminidase domain-containing protein [Candidatus Mediterraneibacter ornithocaccae]